MFILFLNQMFFFHLFSCFHLKVNQITELIVELMENWPEEWGFRNPSSVCVLARYDDQIRILRSSLKASGYSSVSIEKVQNVQGIANEFSA